MKAVRIHAFGDANVLKLDDVPVPAVGDEDVLIRVVAAGVNPVDWKIREGHLKDFIPHRLPLTLGWDVSGVVEAVGRAARRLRPGDLVYTRPDIARDGAYAEYIVVREREVALRPTTISHVEAASLPLAGITAWEAIVTVGQVHAGQRVLIHAAAGGVGSLAVQLAKWRGAEVIATASARNADFVTFLGADQVVDYTKVDVCRETRGVDLVFDTLGGEVQQASWATLKPGGMLVSIVQPPDESTARARGLRSAFVFIEPSRTILDQLAGLVDAGQVRPLVGAEFALRDAAAAHRLSESGHARGKIVLYVSPP
jgi:NADPH:quinone reductase-like Zn-dependent oxidoreductase